MGRVIAMMVISGKSGNTESNGRENAKDNIKPSTTDGFHSSKM
jgi:hypothetical protein